MKNILKTLVISFASIVMFTTQSNAGELTVTGTAKATYNVISGGNQASAGAGHAKAIGIANEIDFTASGELDNGYTWGYQVQFDPGDTTAVAGDGKANGVDDSKLTLTTPYGTVGVFQTEGGLRVENKGSQSVYARPTDIGLATGINTTNDIDGFNNIQYHTAAGMLPYSTSIKVGYASGLQNNMNSSNAVGEDPSAAADSATQIQILATPMDGLNVGADYFMDNGTKLATGDTNQVQENESGGVFFNYAIGAASIGASHSRQAPRVSRTANEDIATETREDRQTKVSVAYNVTDNTSVSYEREDGSRESFGPNEDASYEGQSLQVAHNMGGMTATVAYSQHDSVSYTSGNDMTQILFAVAMAF